MAATKKRARKRAVTKQPAGAAARGARSATRRPSATARASRAVRRPRPLKRRQEPETLRLRTASPSLTVADLHKSLVFYSDVLGFFVRQRWEEDGKLLGLEMQAGSVSFYLGQDDWAKGRERKKGEGFRIWCTTAQDIDALARTIKARGGVLEHEPTDRSWGARDFALVDPDGYKITISSEPTEN